MNQTVKNILLVLGVIIVILLPLSWWQTWRRHRQLQQFLGEQIDLTLERQASGQLLERLETLKQVRETLALPQVELNIKI